ncbi:uncharacterized protein LOC143044461 isoform X1 [Mytilus galloprovincialis]|uniref:uncharacterized protein LOC143044461 isoform X1 n=1 Tax=Mytilus galloprovincialis TaxID=29158 RepID=UPI003F7C0B6E
MNHHTYLFLMSILMIRNMDILSCVVVFHVLTGIYGKGLETNTINWHCKGYNGVAELFSCVHRKFYNEKGCMEKIKMVIQTAMHKNFTMECLVEQSKLPCTKCAGNNSCSDKLCRELLSVFIEELQNRHKRSNNDRESHNSDDATSGDPDDENKNKNGEENRGVDETEQDEKTTIDHVEHYDDTTESYNNDENKRTTENEKGQGKRRKEDRENNKNEIFKLGAIVGISVGITGTIILFLIILVIIFVCRRRSKKRKRKNITRLQPMDQRFEMANLKSNTSCTNKEEYHSLSTNKSQNTDEAQGEYFVLDPSITKYDKDLRNRNLPEIARCSSTDGDENVYYEIDEDKMKSSTDLEGVHKKQIKEGRVQGSLHSYRTKDLLGSTKKSEQLTRLISDDQRIEMANFESSKSSTKKEENIIIPANTVGAQGEYFVLDPSVTKYDKDLSSRVLQEDTKINVSQGEEKVYSEIVEIETETSKDGMSDHQKQVEEVRDIAIYHTDLTNNRNQIGFDNTTYNVTLKVEDQIY